MRILICLATELEKRPLEDRLRQVAVFRGERWFFGQHELTFLVTGVGSVATTYTLCTMPDIRSFDVCLQVGIAGSFNPAMPIGTVVEVTSERFADLGIQDNDGRFADVYAAGLVPPDTFPFQQGVLLNPRRFTRLPSAAGITVNKVHGKASSIQQVQALYNPDVESMEGAGFFYTALQLGIPFCQLRAISNRVEPRDKSGWNIPLALDHLATEVIRFLESDLE